MYLGKRHHRVHSCCVRPSPLLLFINSDCSVYGHSALARAGKSVVHVDRNAYYGGPQASLTSTDLRAWLTEHANQDFINDNNKKDDRIRRYSQVEVTGDIMAAMKSGSVDLHPRWLLCQSEMVKVLVDSNVGQYLEFKLIPCSYVRDLEGDRWQRVPHRKEDVFLDAHIDVLTKRKLMRFLQHLQATSEEDSKNPELYKGQEHTRTRTETFAEHLQSQFKLDKPWQQHVIGHALGLLPRALHTYTPEEGLDQVRRYLASIGRYGPGALLFPLYGTSELCQAFARLSAVYGGIYILRHPGLEMTFEKDSRCTGIKVQEGEHSACFEAKHVVSTLDRPHVPGWTTQRRIARCIVLHKRPIYVGGVQPQVEKESDHAPDPPHIFILPATLTRQTVFLFQTDTQLGQAPADTFITYMWTHLDDTHQESAKSILEPIVRPFFEETLAVLYFTEHVYPAASFTNAVHVCPRTGVHYIADMSPDRMDMDEAVAVARHVYADLMHQMDSSAGDVPPFLPAPPNPDDDLLVQTYLKDTTEVPGNE